jgi:two-component system sensor histidine kinase QseC
LETAIEREKAFAGDAAHELRTPLALLKIELENAKANYDDPLLFSGIEQGVERLGHLVEQILVLHRHSPEMLMNEFEAMELGAITREVIADNYQLIENKQQHLELVASNHPAFIEGNRFAIRAMISNLLSNAIKYTPEGGQIRLTIESDLLKTVLKVEDSGMGIPEDKRDRVFDRFVRIHSASTNKVYGAGLGLAIVKQAAHLHDAKIAIENSAFASGTCFRVEFSTFHMTEEAQ